MSNFEDHNENFKFNIDQGTQEVIVRHGAAMPVREIVPVVLTGVLSSPFDWMMQRHENDDDCHVIVNRDAMKIRYVQSEFSVYANNIAGVLELHRKFKDFGINSGKYITPLEMAEFIKMNRSYFENRQYAMDLVTKLTNFKAKVNRDVEMESKIGKGDHRVLINQVVNQNLPEAFNVVVPVFKGAEKQTLEVEVYFKPEDLTCTLVSPEANDFVETERDKLIDEQVDQIRKEWPGIPIIEV